MTPAAPRAASSEATRGATDADGEVGNQRGRETRRRILEAGDRCFAEYGLALTLEQVAAEAGTTRMTVHRHMGGREQLVTHLVLRASARLGDELRAVLDRPGHLDRRLVDALVLTVTSIRATPALAALFGTADPATPWLELDPDNRVLGTVHAFFVPYLQRAGVEGRLRVEPAEAVAWLLSEVLTLLVIPALAPDEPSVRQRISRFAIPAVFDPAGSRL